MSNIPSEDDLHRRISEGVAKRTSAEIEKRMWERIAELEQQVATLREIANWPSYADGSLSRADAESMRRTARAALAATVPPSADVS